MSMTEVTIDLALLPASIREHVSGAKLYDSSCRSEAKTYRVEGAIRAYLKMDRKGALEREAGMTRYLNSLRLAPRVIAYESGADLDYLLTEAIEGEAGSAPAHLGQPEKLARVFGESLRMLHSLPTEPCPYRTVHVPETAADAVILHGDYCLPNIILDRFTFKAFIDLGEGGVGDRHYDLAWGIWTLRYNLRTDRYRDLFLDAYGRQDVHMDRLRVFSRRIDES